MRYSLLFVFIFGLLACNSGGQELEEVQILRGETMGTYYQVSYVGSQQPFLQEEIDSLLRAINAEVSTYEPNSVISRFNKSARGIALGEAPHFWINLEIARSVFNVTDGAFDATVMPLVNFWGFGFTEDRQGREVDTVEVNRIRSLVGFDQVRMEGDSLLKEKPEIQLDFSACAKGYGVDEVGRLLEKRSLGRYLVDIGGESRARGVKPGGSIWRVGINMPDEDASVNEIITAFPLENRSVATSGNYRNWYEVDGVKYSHTINPRSGFPERTELLSASVFHRDCAVADAYATSCMVLGVEKALSLAESNPAIEIYLIFSRPDGSMETRYTSGLNALFNE
ncbi:FAD:protein FMN transferase [Flavilitoribacter nigricans]|uniref:FAD:protein FMN transferase n=1 Tax=Flavilitoribacter nigricans (strain ATCC 23147 / DSM 23189 / NBRC 102662 / NCIMB 1420 / SS-2) TaxID=1122177 RepID=A0A2D0NBK7_FLAN2|nr:FAD:protein FMN transferase [Flavilitoribacter nigricans]PHN05768.1 thiamine biosynthesis protein ApbE [Flavilitoribacter nigricans DSM 23189 = NBRC 102662]